MGYGLLPTLVFVGVGRNSCDDFGTEALIVAVEAVLTDVITTIEAYYLQPSSSHCELAEGLTMARRLLAARKKRGRRGKRGVNV